MDDLVRRADEVLKDVTPGPWIRVDLDVRDARDFSVADCTVCVHDQPEIYANARFIAAARELVPAMRDRIEADAKLIAELEAELASGSFYKEADIDALMNRAEAAEARVKVLEDALRAGIVCTSEHGGAAKFLKIARAALEGEK